MKPIDEDVEAAAIAFVEHGISEWGDKSNSLQTFYIGSMIDAIDMLKSRGWQKVPEGYVVVPNPETMYALINSSGYRVVVCVTEREAKEAAFGSLPGGYEMNDLSDDDLWDMAAKLGYSISLVEVIDRAMIAAKE